MLCTISRKNEFTIKGFFNKREQIHRKLHICSHLLTESFIYCAVILANVNDFPVYYTVFKTTYSGVKTKKLTSNFPTRIFWHVKGMNIPSQKMPGYKYPPCPEQGFYDLTKARYGWISHSHVSCESHAVESGLLAEIKQNINILIDFEISHLKNQSLWIN